MLSSGETPPTDAQTTLESRRIWPNDVLHGLQHAGAFVHKTFSLAIDEAETMSEEAT